MKELIALGGLTAFLTAITLIYLIPVIASWKIFQKAGIAGWKSLVPVYNLYLIYKIAGMSGFWAIPKFVAASLAAYIQQNNITAVSALTIIFLIVAIVAVIGGIIKAIKLSKAFGKGIGFIILMIIFSDLGELILGFGKAEYQGDYKE